MWIILWFVQGVFSITGLVATYLPLWASYKGWDMWGIAWQIWAMIGFTIFWVSLASIILRLYLENRKLTSKDAKLERRIRQLKLEELEEEKMKRDSLGTF